MTDYPIIDIRIAAYNEERLIGRALEALVRQTYPFFRVTIHDNASTDATRDVCRAFMARDQRFSLRVNSCNIGREMNGIRCYHSFERDFVMYRSANDAMDPTCLEKLMKVMLSDSRIALVYAGAHEVDKDGQIIQTIPDSFLFETNPDDILGSARTVMSLYTHPMAHYGLRRASIFDKCWVRPFSYGNDHIMTCQLALLGAIRCVREPLFLFQGTRNPSHWFEDVARKAHSQVEEFDWGVDPEAGFYPMEEFLPFIHMVHGHIEMFSKAKIDHALREPLCALAREVLTHRFAPFINVELKVYANRLHDVLYKLATGQKTFGPIERAYFLRRIVAELYRVTLVLPDVTVLRDLRRAVLAALEQEDSAPPPPIAPPEDTDGLFQRALQHHQSGRLPEAERLYRQVLGVQPTHGDALHMLGVLTAQLGRYDEAVQILDRVALRQSSPTVIHNLAAILKSRARALHQQGRTVEAEADLQRARTLET